MLYVALFQIGLAVTLVTGLFTVGFEMQLAVPVLGMLVSFSGQIAMGYCAATERSVLAGAFMWLLGVIVTIAGFASFDDLPLGPLVVGIAQLSCGPIVLAAVARRLPESRTPLRRELGALLLLIGAGGVIGSVWNVIWMSHMYGSLSLVGLATISIEPGAVLVISVFALRAARSMLDGDQLAARRLAQWKWIAIGVGVAIAILAAVSIIVEVHEVPLSVIIQPLVHGALGCVLPLVIGQLGRRALAVPVAPTDSSTVPTVCAWGALWFVPMLACGALVARMTFVAAFASTDSQLSLIAAICGFAAVLLLATALTVLRAAPVARYITQVTAELATCVLGYFIYLGLSPPLGDPVRAVAAAVPVGSVAAFAVAMIALAWFESRREQDLAPARVVS
ncbi:hypothetical protein BH11MYX2_BH11MYX2_39790 [soil metagenome]